MSLSLNIGKRRETSFTKPVRVTSIPYSQFFDKPVQGIYAGKREAVVSLRLVDGTIISGFRLPKQKIINIEFIGVTTIQPSLDKVELWVLSTPDEVKVVPYV